MLVELLSELEDEAPSGFWERLCEAVCRLSSMERAVLFLYDDARHRVRAMGGYGVDPSTFAHVHITLEMAPIAQRAFAEDRVVEVSDRIDYWVPGELAELFGLTTLTCTPLSAAGRWLGVVIADRGGGHFELTEAESHAMWMLGKTAALAASARLATRQQERARQLTDRIDFARDVHERVIQRLFGVSLVLGSDRELTRTERERCRAETRAALAELRSALQRPLAPTKRATDTTLREELGRLALRYRGCPLRVHWEDGVRVTPDVEPIAQSVLVEALRNAHKHARPTAVDVRVGLHDGAFLLDVVNDGVVGGPRGTGMGLRLAAFEALQLAGVVEFGIQEEGTWRVRLVVPIERT
ncbi:MAG: hypothetical protein M3141_02750 [Actinomycetota bacterium]|nr:hypothetical protein [Actinomycetota bacterium]